MAETAWENITHQYYMNPVAMKERPEPGPFGIRKTVRVGDYILVRGIDAEVIRVDMNVWVFFRFVNKTHHHEKIPWHSTQWRRNPHYQERKKCMEKEKEAIRAYLASRGIGEAPRRWSYEYEAYAEKKKIAMQEYKQLHASKKKKKKKKKESYPVATREPLPISNNSIFTHIKEKLPSRGPSCLPTRGNGANPGDPYQDFIIFHSHDDVREETHSEYVKRMKQTNMKQNPETWYNTSYSDWGSETSSDRAYKERLMNVERGRRGRRGRGGIRGGRGGDRDRRVNSDTTSSSGLPFDFFSDANEPTIEKEDVPKESEVEDENEGILERILDLFKSDTSEESIEEQEFKGEKNDCSKEEEERQEFRREEYIEEVDYAWKEEEDADLSAFQNPSQYQKEQIYGVRDARKFNVTASVPTIEKFALRSYSRYQEDHFDSSDANAYNVSSIVPVAGECVFPLTSYQKALATANEVTNLRDSSDSSEVLQSAYSVAYFSDKDVVGVSQEYQIPQALHGSGEFDLSQTFGAMHYGNDTITTSTNSLEPFVEPSDSDSDSDEMLSLFD